MKLPGPDHPITIEPARAHVRIRFNGALVADTTQALMLRETTLKPVFYIQRADVAMTLLTRTAHMTHCPYKGDAAYFSIRVGERTSDNAIWTYEDPFPAMLAIAGHLAFYPDRVDAIEVETE
jgi:uncharacterized protein (DUF427 family)